MNLLWRPRGVALIGASASVGSVGNRILRYLVQHGYPGQVYPVNPRLQAVEGLPCYPSVVEAPGPVDLALIAVGAERVMSALSDCAAKGIGYAVIFSSGFGETGALGRALEAELVAYARANGIRLIGPNCIGLVSPADRLVAGFSPLFERVTFEPGNLGLVTQSGALGFGIVSLGIEQGLRFSRIITTGNEADLHGVEFVADLLGDDQTEVLLVYEEGMKEAAAWRVLGGMAEARAKPVIILKAGRTETGGRAAISHTAALVGDDEVWEAAFRQLGLFRVDDAQEMLDLAAVFAQPRRAASGRVGVLTTSGGAGILAADALERLGLELPALAESAQAELARIVPPFGSIANPVDVTAQVINDPQLFRRALLTMATDPGLDMLLICFCVLQGAEAERVVEDLVAVHGQSTLPILVSRTGAEFLAPGAAAWLRAAGIPVYPTPERAARAAGALARFGDRRRIGDRPPVPARGPLPAPGAAPEGWPVAGESLSEREVKRLLAAADLPVTREALATTPDEAASLADQIGYPIVLKVDSPEIAHKTEVGGVRVGLQGTDQVRAAFAEIQASVAEARPGARINGCLVQEFIPDAVAELLIGVTPSPMGPVVTVGHGGVYAEAWQDISRRLAPLTEAEAGGMLRELRVWRVLNGFRGRPSADVAALCALIAQVSQLAVTWPGTWELDLNPVLVLPEGQGCRIADGLLVMREG